MSEVLVDTEDTEFGDAFGDDEPEDNAGKETKDGKETDGADGRTSQDADAKAGQGQGSDEGKGKEGLITPESKPDSESKSGDDDKAKPSTDKDQEIDWKAKHDEAEKRFKDNQAAYTKSQQEKAELKKRLEELEAKQSEAAKSSSPESSAGSGPEEMPDDVKTFLADFPEAQNAIIHLAKGLASKEIKAFQESLGDIESLKNVKAIQDEVHRERWERAVVNGFIDREGNYVEGVPDYYRIAAPSNKEYWDWYSSKGYGACDPLDAIARLNEWKTIKEENRIAAETAERDRQAAEKAAKAQEVMKAGLPSSQRKPASQAKPDPNDFDGGFNDD